MHGSLRPCIAIDRDVGSPQIGPGGAVLVEKSVEARRARARRQSQISLRVTAPILTRGSDEFRKGIDLILVHSDIQIQSESKLTFVQRDVGRLYAVWQADPPRFGHP